MGLGADPDADEKPDVWQLFRHYDKLYFRGALVNAAFTLEWTSPRTNNINAFGSCSFGKMSKTITLYRTNRTSADVKKALLHLMIHAIIFVKHGMTCLSSHGPVFRDWMDAINDCTVEDYLRPKGGYCITTNHDFSPEKLCGIQGNLWKCESCGNTLVRATRLGPPSDSCCIENVSQHATCGNMLCYWHNHKMKCDGKYVVPGKRGQKMVLKVKRETSEVVQESDSDEVQENSTVGKPNAEGKLLSQVGCRNARSQVPRKKILKQKQEVVASEKHELFSMVSCNNAKPLGSCSTKKAEEFSPSKLKRKHTSVASKKHEFISVGSCNNAKSSRSNTSSKADKWQEPEHVQKPSVQPPVSQKKPKLEQDLGVSDKYAVFSPGSYNTTKPPGSNTSRKEDRRHTPEGVEKCSVSVPAPQKKLKLETDLVALQQNKTNCSIKAGKRHTPEGVEKSSVPVAALQKKHKLEPDLVALQQNKTNSAVKAGKRHRHEGVEKSTVLITAPQKAHKQREHEQPQKPIARPTAPQSILKQQTKTNSSTKEGKQIPGYFQRTFVQPAVSHSKLKQPNHAAPGRPKRRSKTSSPARKKEYACVSVWANIYESECSSGSAEPLVNKRTERRKRERERAVQITYSRSRKRSAADEQASSRQTKPPSQGLEFIVIDAANKVVTQGPRDQFKAPVPHKDIVVVPPADQVTTQTLTGRSQPPAQCMDIVIPPADLAMTQTHGNLSIPSRHMDNAAVRPADQVMTRAPVHQSQPPAASAIATSQVVPPHSADPDSSNPCSSPDVIDISDDD
ncbi:uncharacterized protein [Lolium perenne]|uniref:uncharacterized protein isoform X1 n=1 Tax=Lolium perenne TaxID=4522 RepID=UPI0021F676EA|nr:uncharacterized protein LOC127301319 isoform X1 [Lolium perenne]